MIGKLAFCFLAYDDIVHPAIWNEFFSAAPPDSFTALLHSKAGIKSSAVADVRIVPTMPTAWGTWSLLEAQQRLMEQACDADSAVTKVVLLSSDALPLWNFSAVAGQLLADDRSWIDIHNTVWASRRAHFAFGRRITKLGGIGSQWVVLSRAHVNALRDAWSTLRATQHVKIADEQIIHTFFRNSRWDTTVKRQPPTFVNWGRPVNTKCPYGPHRHRPHTFCRIVSADIAAARESGALFIRKICRGVPLQGLKFWQEDTTNGSH